MKKTAVFLILFLLLSGTLAPVFNQTPGQAINPHPVIGDTLDRTENQKYLIFTSVRNLERAVFYREDSLVYARIWYHRWFKTKTRTIPLGTTVEFSRMVAQRIQIYEEKIEIQNQLPWSNAFYLAIGEGNPNGYRLDVGTNFWHNLGLGVTFIFDDHWSGSPDVMAGFYLLYHFPILPARITPFARLTLGGDIESAFRFLSDEYFSFSLGTVIPITRSLHFRPETGIYHTSKYISGGKSILFGIDRGPVVEENRTRLGFNLGFEFDLWHVQ
jgi:hypothetical protein